MKRVDKGKREEEKLEEGQKRVVYRFQSVAGIVMQYFLSDGGLRVLLFCKKLWLL